MSPTASGSLRADVPGLSVAALVPVLDEERKIAEVLRRMPRGSVDEILVVDDGSVDRSAEVARSLGARVICMGRTTGVGAAAAAARGQPRSRARKA